jgi:hypothetical protein
MPNHVRAAVFAIVATALCSCASNRVPVYVAPSNQTIEAGTEMSFGGDGQVIYVHNRSSVPIVITGLHLIDCENIKHSCQVQRLHIQVPAGQRMNIVTVKPENANRPYSYRYDYSWEPAREQ